MLSGINLNLTDARPQYTQMYIKLHQRTKLPRLPAAKALHRPESALRIVTNLVALNSLQLPNWNDDRFAVSMPSKNVQHAQFKGVADISDEIDKAKVCDEEKIALRVELMVYFRCPYAQRFVRMGAPYL